METGQRKGAGNTVMAWGNLDGAWRTSHIPVLHVTVSYLTPFLCTSEAQLMCVLLNHKYPQIVRENLFV